MRLSYIVLAFASAIFASCGGVSAVGDSKSLVVPQIRLRTEKNSNRSLRSHQEEERTGDLLAQVAKVLKRTVSEVGRMDKKSLLKDIRKSYKESFLHIENVMRLDPDGMALKMRDMDMIDLTLLEKYVNWYVKKHPSWVSKLE